MIAGGPEWTLLATLCAIAFVSGAAAAAVGPGGVLLVAVLHVSTPLDPGEVAGTASTVFVPGSALGAAAYARSGDMDWTVASVVGVAGLFGTVAGTWLNARISADEFSALLVGLLAVVVASLIVREAAALPSVLAIDPATLAGKSVLAGVGGGVGVLGGLFGIGGPLVAVPLLVLLGTRVVTAVAVAQVLALFVTSMAATSYAVRGTVRWELAGGLLLPFLLGVGAGWVVARRVDARWLRGLLIAALVAVIAGLLV